MNWIAVAVGAGAGVLAVLASVGIMKLLGRSPNSKGASILYVVVFAAALAFGREVVEPQIQARRVESALLAMPIYRALQEHEPQAYQRIKLAMEDAIARKLPQEQMWVTTRPVVGEVTSRRLPHAADDVLVKFAEHVVAALTLLHSKGGTSCFSYLHPGPGEAVDFAALLGKDFATRELDLVAELVVSAAGKKRPPLAEADAAPELEAVITKLLATYKREDLAALDNPKAPNLDKRRYCEIITALYREAASLPAPRGPRLVRYLMQG